MKKSQDFWQKIEKKPILALAPMAGYSDSPFRQMCRKYGADVVYSEMASVSALVYSPAKTLELVAFEKKERPYVVQLFGADPEHFAIAAKIIAKKVKPDGIDINFGCPVKKVQKQGAGAALMNDLKLSRRIIEATINSVDLPVSIKARTRVGEVDVLRFLDNVSDLNIAALMLHGRTISQGFSGPADWQMIKKARDHFGGILLANGGVNSRENGLELLAKTGADGLGIARGAWGRPWIFDEIKNGGEKSIEEIKKIAIEHSRLAAKLKGEQAINEMRKHLCFYVQGMPGAKKLREQLVRVDTLKGIEEILK